MVCRPGKIKIWSFLARRSHWAKSLNPGLLGNIRHYGLHALSAPKETQDLTVPCPYNYTTVGLNTIKSSPYLTIQHPYTACDSTNVLESTTLPKFGPCWSRQGNPHTRCSCPQAPSLTITCLDLKTHLK